MRIKNMFIFGLLLNTLGAWATPDAVMIQRALLVAPETAVNIDTIFRSLFDDKIIQCQIAAGHCDVVAQGDFVNLNFQGQDMSGKRICLTNHIAVYINHLNGTEDNPAIISNCGGISSIKGTNKALWVRFSRYVRITGTGHSSYPIGLKFSGAHNTIDITDGSSDIQIDHADIETNSLTPDGTVGTGISFRSYPACVDGQLAHTRPDFTQFNSIVKGNYIHDVRSEGMYIGTSHHHLVEGFSPFDCDGNGDLPAPQADLRGVIVENNVLFNIGGDGIQVGAVIEDGFIKNNLVLDYGTRGS